MAREVRFGILGCANIARTLVKAMKLLPEVRIHAIASRSEAKAKEFAAANGLETAIAYGSYDALLDDADIDAVYIPLPRAFTSTGW